MAKHLATGRQNSSSELVRDLGETKGAGFGLRTSPQELEQETMATTSSAVALLQTRQTRGSAGVGEADGHGSA